MKGYKTFSPDKNGLFLTKRLGDIISMSSCPNFTYERILQRVKYIDVIWFNQRGYPANVIEVEHSTNFRNSFLKFLELQDFATKMTVVASKIRQKQFHKEMQSPAFQVIEKRALFMSYEEIEQVYSATKTMPSSFFNI